MGHRLPHRGHRELHGELVTDQVEPADRLVHLLRAGRVHQPGAQLGTEPVRLADQLPLGQLGLPRGQRQDELDHVVARHANVTGLHVHRLAVGGPGALDVVQDGLAIVGVGEFLGVLEGRDGRVLTAAGTSPGADQSGNWRELRIQRHATDHKPATWAATRNGSYHAHPSRTQRPWQAGDLRSAAGDPRGGVMTAPTGYPSQTPQDVTELVDEAVFLAHEWLAATEAGETPAERRTSQQLSSDRKSTRLNSSHVAISYAVFCLKE